MRKEFVPCANRAHAIKLTPWACVIARVTGGFMCFESRDDYAMWKAQK